MTATVDNLQHGAMSGDPKLTAFSYAILGLVGRNGAGPHDIVRMMREGAVFWTTSESHFYAEPKRLAKLGYLAAEKQPGRTRERTHYRLTDAGRQALTDWLPQPAAMPRIQNEAALKLLAADFSDDETILASLDGLREHIAEGYAHLENMEARVALLPHRTTYLRVLNELARRTLDTQREWLDHVDTELGRPATHAHHH
jgi:DNA-binding PadR family transcriptional regulator